MIASLLKYKLRLCGSISEIYIKMPSQSIVDSGGRGACVLYAHVCVLVHVPMILHVEARAGCSVSCNTFFTA